MKKLFLFLLTAFVLTVSVKSQTVSEITNILNTKPQLITTAAVSANNTNILSLDLTTAGYRSITILFTGTWVATAQFQGSNDNFTTVSAVYGYQPNNLTPTFAAGTSTSNQTFVLNTHGFRYIRVRTTSYTSGTINSVAYGMLNNSPFEGVIIQGIPSVDIASGSVVVTGGSVTLPNSEKSDVSTSEVFLSVGGRDMVNSQWFHVGVMADSMNPNFRGFGIHTKSFDSDVAHVLNSYTTPSGVSPLVVGISDANGNQITSFGIDQTTDGTTNKVRATGTVKPSYAATTSMTITNLSALASSATVGWQSAKVSNLSTLATDYEINIKCTMANTAPANDKAVYVYVVPFYTSDAGTTWYASSQGTTTLPTGTEGATTIASPNNLRLLGVLNYTTQNMVLQDTWNLSTIFGNRMPDGFSIILINYTGAALATTSGTNNIVQYTPISDVLQ